MRSRVLFCGPAAGAAAGGLTGGAGSGRMGVVAWVASMGDGALRGGSREGASREPMLRGPAPLGGRPRPGVGFWGGRRGADPRADCGLRKIPLRGGFGWKATRAERGGP